MDQVMLLTKWVQNYKIRTLNVNLRNLIYTTRIKQEIKICIIYALFYQNYTICKIKNWKDPISSPMQKEWVGI